MGNILGSIKAAAAGGPQGLAGSMIGKLTGSDKVGQFVSNPMGFSQGLASQAIGQVVGGITGSETIGNLASGATTPEGLAMDTLGLKKYKDMLPRVGVPNIGSTIDSYSKGGSMAMTDSSGGMPSPTSMLDNFKNRVGI